MRKEEEDGGYGNRDLRALDGMVWNLAGQGRRTTVDAL